MSTATIAIAIPQPFIIDNLFASEEAFVNPYQLKIIVGDYSRRNYAALTVQPKPQTQTQIVTDVQVKRNGDNLTANNYVCPRGMLLAKRNEDLILVPTAELKSADQVIPTSRSARRKVSEGFSSPTTKETYPEDTEYPAIACGSTSERDGGDRLADLRYEQKKSAIQAAYEEYINRGALKEPQFAIDDFLKAVFKFAQGKIKSKVFALPDNSIRGADDFALEVVEKVRQHIDRVEGGASGFYAWLTQVCVNAAADAFNEITAETNGKVALEVEMQEGDDAGFIVQNPLIQTNRVWFREGQPVNDTRKLSMRPPAWVDTFSDRFIWSEVATGVPYKELADVVGSTEAGIKMKVKRWKTEIDKRRRRAREQKKRDEASLRAELEDGLNN
jgi:hypothetical protein